MKTFENVFVYAIYVDDLYVLHTRNVLSFEIILLVLGFSLFQTSNLHQLFLAVSKLLVYITL